jgi:hypothetical protein
MKKAILYLLLFTYSTIILKPVLPAVTDCVAHIFWYSEHVGTVHFENGKYHVHNEMIEASKKNLPEQNHPDQKREVSADEHLVITTPHYIFTSTIIQNPYPSLSCFIKNYSAAGDTPPPKI